MAWPSRAATPDAIGAKGDAADLEDAGVAWTKSDADEEPAATHKTQVRGAPAGARRRAQSGRRPNRRGNCSCLCSRRASCARAALVCLMVTGLSFALFAELVMRIAEPPWLADLEQRRSATAPGQADVSSLSQEPGLGTVDAVQPQTLELAGLRDPQSSRPGTATIAPQTAHRTSSYAEISEAEQPQSLQLGTTTAAPQTAHRTSSYAEISKAEEPQSLPFGTSTTVPQTAHRTSSPAAVSEAEQPQPVRAGWATTPAQTATAPGQADIGLLRQEPEPGTVDAMQQVAELGDPQSLRNGTSTIAPSWLDWENYSTPSPEDISLALARASFAERVAQQHPGEKVIVADWQPAQIFALARASFAEHVERLPLGKKVIVAGLQRAGQNTVFQIMKLWLEAVEKPGFKLCCGYIDMDNFDESAFSTVGTAAVKAHGVSPWLKQLSSRPGVTVLLSHRSPKSQLMSISTTFGDGTKMKDRCDWMERRQRCQYLHFDHVDYDMSLDDLKSGGAPMLAKVVGRIADALGVAHTEADVAEIQRRYQDYVLQTRDKSGNSKNADLRWDKKVGKTLQAEVDRDVDARCRDWEKGKGSIKSNSLVLTSKESSQCMITTKVDARLQQSGA